MANTILTQARLQELLHYDLETGVFTWKVNRSGTAKAGTRAGTANTSGHIQIMADRKMHLGHKLAWLYVTGEFPSTFMDHINRDPADNRFSNLRLCTHAQNMQNKGRYRNNTTGVPGVYPAPSGRWKAAIGVGGKFRSLGTHPTFEAAVAARQAAQAAHHAFAGPEAHV